MEIKALKLPEDEKETLRERFRSWVWRTNFWPPFLRLPQPPAPGLPMRKWGAKPGDYTWEDFEAEMRPKYPIRYWIHENVVDFIKYSIFKPIGNLFYWIRTHTYNRYHILNLKCPNHGLEYGWGWIDRSESILIAPFEILKDFVEKELPYSHVDWESDDVHSEVHKEMHELYEWWMRGRQQSWKEYYAEGEKLVEAKLDRDVDGAITDEYRAHLFKMEELEGQDDVMLVRLAVIRGFLWT